MSREVPPIKRIADLELRVADLERRVERLDGSAPIGERKAIKRKKLKVQK